MHDGTYTAVVDRVVDEETAVLLVEDDGDVIEQLDCALGTLPTTGRHEGAVFEITVEEDAVVEWTHCPEQETHRRARLKEKFDRLSERLDDSS